jgi:hypothetical protein
MFPMVQDDTLDVFQWNVLHEATDKIGMGQFTGAVAKSDILIAARDCQGSMVHLARDDNSL